MKWSWQDHMSGPVPPGTKFTDVKCECGRQLMVMDLAAGLTTCTVCRTPRRSPAHR